MRIKASQLLISGLFASVSAVSMSESLYQISAEQMTGVTLFDQILKSESLVAIKPSLLGGEASTAQTSLDLSRCLWSVDVNFDSEVVAFTPGKMICVGPNQEVLEAVPSGTIMPFGQCSDTNCSSYVVKGNSQVSITLNAPIEFSLQPRNER